MAETNRKYEGFVPGAHDIEGFGAGGFRFAGMSHRGSLLALPSGIRAWTATTPAEITFASLAPVLDEAPGSIELLLIGTGPEIRPIHPDLRARLKAAGIGVDPMATTHAISTYNILFSEKRRVAAALLAVA
ncbi:MAG: MTH938/NDUFAF3 family protein [Beijerinckiaceae bacterium]|jgi:uncharacterized protein|nr:MTH938/NDUFAF3 family protein [Beijerinckiaceae bacterium]